MRKLKEIYKGNIIQVESKINKKFAFRKRKKKNKLLNNQKKMKHSFRYKQ